MIYKTCLDTSTNNSKAYEENYILVHRQLRSFSFDRKSLRNDTQRGHETAATRNIIFLFILADYFGDQPTAASRIWLSMEKAKQCYYSVKDLCSNSHGWDQWTSKVFLKRTNELNSTREGLRRYLIDVSFHIKSSVTPQKPKRYFSFFSSGDLFWTDLVSRMVVRADLMSRKYLIFIQYLVWQFSQ